MKIAVIAPSFKDFMLFVNSDCNRFHIKDDAVIRIENGNITFPEHGIAYVWFYTIFTSQPNVKILVKFDEVIVLEERIDKEMDECYDFLKERNFYAKHIRSQFKI